MPTPILITRTALELYAHSGAVNPPSRAYAKDAAVWARTANIAISMAESDGLCTRAEATQAKNQIALWLKLDARVQFPL
jgi:hypothetical protein